MHPHPRDSSLQWFRPSISEDFQNTVISAGINRFSRMEIIRRERENQSGASGTREPCSGARLPWRRDKTVLVPSGTTRTTMFQIRWNSAKLNPAKLKFDGVRWNGRETCFSQLYRRSPAKIIIARCTETTLVLDICK